MFKSISNNFGAPEITFRDFQTDRYAVLNARFSYDPSNEAYLAASELEIKVPDLSLSKSTDAGVFAVYRDERTYQWSDTPSRYHFATVLRSCIRDRSTLCIEKLTDFDAYGPVTIYIYAMYSALNTGEDTVLSERTRLVIMASAPQSNGVTRAYSKAVGIGSPKEAVSDEYDLKADYDAKFGAPGEAAPKVFMKWFFVDTTTGEVSGEQMALAQLTAATEPDAGA